MACVKNATRGLLSVVQAFVIKYLLFDKRAKEKSVPLDVMLRPNEDDQQGKKYFLNKGFMELTILS